ncbi:MAG: AMP-binding protein [Vicinamibacteraceae bacterium]|nr:AMP-binding protein [Vicinamibacteraceae bacterium]
MAGRETLLEFFDDLAARQGTFLVHDDGLRAWSYTYGQIARASARFADVLAGAGFVKGDTLLIWGENCPEWIVALWGALLSGVVAVPIDYRASPAFLARVATVVGARGLAAGDQVERDAAPALPHVWRLRDLLRSAAPATEEAGQGGAGGRRARPPVTRDDTAQIIFTSGATAEPKGVVITHRNLLANIEPVEAEIAKYRRFLPLAGQLRFLNLLPLSHLFGQSLATFIPPLVGGMVVFMHGYNPHEIVRQIKGRRVSLLVSVPKILDVVHEYLLQRFPSVRASTPAAGHWLRRWWQYRDLHSALGWRFWGFIVGAAPLDAALERAVRSLGFLVIQGYGLTETAPIVTMNHPFATRAGTVGKPLKGVEVCIAPDGEVLVRGENVTRGYFRAPEETAGTFEDGWLHTGDIGAFDEEGRLVIRGRKKEMIVTPEGLNVFPDDVERVLNAIDGIEESAVVGLSERGEERVHAVVVARADVDLGAVVRAANAELADHQRLRGVTRWPSEELPRTEGTRKLRRSEIRAWLGARESGTPPPVPAAGRARRVEDVIAAHAPGRAGIGPPTTLEELGLTSLERVELLMALEAAFDVVIDEVLYAEARTVGDLAALVEAESDRPARPAAATQTGAGAAPVRTPAETRAPATTPRVGGAVGSDDVRDVSAPSRAEAVEAREPIDFPSWNRRAWALLVRKVFLTVVFFPILRVIVRLDVRGREHLEGLDGPVVFAANHQSHLDSPVVMAALPSPWRWQMAIAMAKEFFRAHFYPREHGRLAWFTNSLNYYLAALVFNAFPLPQREAGGRHTVRYIGALLSEGTSILIFPEGIRTEQGEIRPFRAGVGLLAGRLCAPVVPVRLEGLERVLHHTWRWPRRGAVRVTFGPALRLEGDDYARLAGEIEAAVRGLGSEDSLAGGVGDRDGSGSPRG